ncbi:type IV secretory system conjugative DNA transfer family protein [Undibacterium sp. SXout7W]|uniref:type IV secretory system conjugative DNA transfer family protein n=1 Tax=Undibacterium sp. SXout7W TaxID=3413049 RepID=UPI003BF08757
MTLNLNAKTCIKYGVIAWFVVLPIVALHMGALLFCVWNGIPDSTASPLMLWKYHVAYTGQKPVQLKLLVSTLVPLISLLAVSVLFFGKPKKSLHGEARFATKSELDKAGLFGNDGVIIGKFNNQFLVISEVLHVLLASATRGGKGVAIVITNLLFWRHSLVNTDIKLENFKITSKIRQIIFKNEIFKFDPFNSDGLTHQYNPLFYIDLDNKRKMIDDIQVIANLFFPDVDGKDPIWTSTPKTLFMGLIMYLIETPGKVVSVGQVLRESMVAGDGSDYLKAVIQQRKHSDMPLSMECESFLTTYAGIDADATRAGIIAGFRSRLELWANPLIDAATSGNDFDFRDLRKKRMTIYNGLKPRDIKRAAILNSIFWQQLISVNLNELPEHNPKLKYKVLLLMDEFGVLGNLDVLFNGVAFIAGYGLQLLTIFQGPGQLIPIYKQKDAVANFLDNHHAHVIYTPPKNDSDISDSISKALGYFDLTTKTFSKSKDIWKDSGSINTSDQKRALMSPQELREMDQSREIILYRETHPIQATKALYYKNSYFVELLAHASPTLGAKKKRWSLFFNGYSKKDIEKAMERSELEIKSPRIDYAKFDSDVKTSMRMAHEVMEIEHQKKAEEEAKESGKEIPKNDKQDTQISENSDVFPENIALEREITHADLQNIYNMPVELFSFDPLDLSVPEEDPLDEFALLELANNAISQLDEGDGNGFDEHY